MWDRVRRHVESYSRSRASVCLGVVLCIGFWRQVLPTFGSGLTHIPGDLGDSRLVNYILEHGYYYLTGRVASFWDAPFLYPWPHVTAYSENLLGSLPFYAVARFVTGEREAAYQWWFLAGFALNYLAMAYVLRRLRFSLPSAMAGAFVFAFSPAQLNFLTHPQLLYRFCAPLAFFHWNSWLERCAVKDLVCAGLFFCWQCYISLYLGYFLGLTLLAYAAGIIALGRLDVGHYVRRRWPIGAVRDLAVVGGVAVALGLLVWPYLSGQVPGNLVGEVSDLLPQPVSYLLGSPGDYLVGLFSVPPHANSRFPREHRLFMGLVPLASVMIVTAMLLVRRLRSALPPFVPPVIIAIWSLFVLTLSWDGASVYHLVLSVAPSVSGIRGVTRIVVLALYLVSIVTAALIEVLITRHRQVAYVVVPIVLLGTFAECTPPGVSYGKGDSQRRIREIADSVGVARRQPGQREEPVLAALGPTTHPDWIFFQLDAMLAAQDLNVPTLNGFTRVAPPGHRRLLDGCGAVALTLRDYEAIFGKARIEPIARGVIVYPPQVSCTPF
jgi:hypothetical protein